MFKSSSSRASKLTALIGASVLLTGSLASGVVATAATLPDGDQVFILPCADGQYHGYLYEVATNTGEASRVGEWDRPEDEDVFACAGPGAYNPANGLGYWISWADENYLVSVDLVTGVNTVVGEFTLATNPSFMPVSLAINSQGEAWVTDFNEDVPSLYSVDLETAVVTRVGSTGVSVAHKKGNYGLAWDPVTDKVYAYNNSSHTLYTVSTTSGLYTVLETEVFWNEDSSDYDTIYAMAFDSSGQLWGNNGYIVSASLGDLDGYSILDVIHTDGEANQISIYTESIIIAYASTSSPSFSPPAPVAAPTPNYFIAVAFDKGKAKLKKSMRAFIRKELNSRSGEVRAVCVGTVRGKKWTPKREALALARATSGCDYVNKLNPGLPVELKKRLIAKGKGNPLTVRVRVFY